MEKFKVSVVVPAYNEEGNLTRLVQTLLPILSVYNDYEIILINDGSSDKTIEVMKQLHHDNSRVHYISLSRNFGHQYALKAGLDAAIGDCVISMDADLQHPPRLIPALIDGWQKGYDIVYTTRQDKGTESFFKRFSSEFFYKFFRVLTGLKIPAGAADFRLLDKKVVQTLKNMPEKALFLRGLIYWMGFKQFAISYQVEPRFSGRSSYSLKKMLGLAIAGATSFSIKPLRLAIYLGFIVALLGCLSTAYVLYMKLFAGSVITGWSSLMCVLLILGGSQLFVMGIIGEYIGRIFVEMKNRPNYIIDETSLEQK
ncbi:MAG: glycosyltransferase [Alphaproteobacteria bacterium]|nr:glycosyltransferase [Alphaproteobacteria bacterium]